MNPLAFLTGLSPRLYLWLGILLSLAAAYLWHRVDVERHEKASYLSGQAETQARWDAAEKVRAETAEKAEAAARAEEQRRAAAQQEVLNENQVALDRARADAAGAVDAAARLRQRIAAIVASPSRREAASGPSAAASGPTAGDATGMLADVLGRCMERVQRLAEIADSARVAGNACVEAYDSLTEPTP